MESKTDDSTEVVASISSDLLACIAEAGAGYRHAEVIVQQRLYNFLMAASMLLLAAAAVLSTGPKSDGALFVVTVSLLGLPFSVAWAILGKRQKHFIDLHMEIIQALEGCIEHRPYRVWEPIADLRLGKSVVFPVTKRSVKLSKTELSVRSSNLLSDAPIGFAVIFIVLAGIGFFRLCT